MKEREFRAPRRTPRSAGRTAAKRVRREALRHMRTLTRPQAGHACGTTAKVAMETEGRSVVPDAAASGRGGAPLRLLIAVEDGHAVYRETIEQYLRAARPDFEVFGVALHEFDTELARLEPRVVVRAGSPTPVPDRPTCWVELSLDPGLPTEVRVGDTSRRVLNPSLSDLLAVIDRVATL